MREVFKCPECGKEADVNDLCHGDDLFGEEVVEYLCCCNCGKMAMIGDIHKEE